MRSNKKQKQKHRFKKMMASRPKKKRLRMKKGQIRV